MPDERLSLPAQHSDAANSKLWDTLETSLASCMRRDRYRLGRRLRALKKGDRSHSPNALKKLTEEINQSVRTLDQRRADSVSVTFPEALPVVQRLSEIRDLIKVHPVVILCGETGSGKSTQLPKICLDMGRGTDGSIAHTQPRRLAARALAGRVAEETGTELGGLVGYRVRFDQRHTPHTRVHFLTDGLLLAELESDRFLNAYDTIIIDEAHERSLNIDLLLGHVKQLTKRRSDLRVIVTSATIDPDRFSRFFDDAPIIEVSGRMYPVEVRYRPTIDDKGVERFPFTDASGPQVIAAPVIDAIDEILKSGDGDALVFLPGEREIRVVCDEANKRFAAKAEILPLYARLDRAAQDRVFKPGKQRRIVVATNVAETSVTVPRIQFVVDSGVARINRYNPGQRIERLSVEKISQAAAEQRKGRSGRVQAGICYRLYSEEDFDTRAQFTDPEISRTSLADVILRLHVLGLGTVKDFPFIEPPDARRIRDGLRVLEELGAIASDQQVTRLGRKLARMPIDVRLGRMLLAADKFACVEEVLTITAALSIPEPRITPADRLEQARTRHRELENAESDFLTLLDLYKDWSAITGERRTARRAQFCRDNFLSFTRMHEWSDLRKTLRQSAKDSGLTLNGEAAKSNAVHRALLSGLLANVCQHDEGGTFIGTHGKKLRVHPSSSLRSAKKSWLMAAELMETNALYARTAAPIRPQWIEETATTQLRKNYSNVRWDRRRGSVYADERVTLYGLTLVAKRRVRYGGVNPEESRQVFIQHALVECDFDIDDDWYQRNLALLDEARTLEERFRRRDLRVDESFLFAFFDERIPAKVNSRESFRHWWKKAGDSQPGLLEIDRALMIDDSNIDLSDRPTTMACAGLDVDISYRFDPGVDDDGVTVRLPLSLLNQVEARTFEWLVPGLLQDKLVQLCRLLPKDIRKRLVPVPDTVARIAQDLEFGQGDLLNQFAQALLEEHGVHIPIELWRTEALEPLFRMRFELIDSKLDTLATSRDLDVLQNEFGTLARDDFESSGHWEIERDDVRRWDFGTLPDRIEKKVGAGLIVGYPALVDAGTTCSITIFDSPDKARVEQPGGVRKLLLLQIPGARRLMSRNMPNIEELCLLYLPLGPCSNLREQLTQSAIEWAVGDFDLSVRDQASFDPMAAVLQDNLMPALTDLCEVVLQVLRIWRDIRMRLDEIKDRLPPQTVDDIQQHLAELLTPDFVIRAPRDWLSQFPRLLRAVLERIASAQADPRRDLARQEAFKPAYDGWARRVRDGVPEEICDDMRWWLEELRVSIYAQKLGTTFAVSVKRLDREWQRRLSAFTGTKV